MPPVYELASLGGLSLRPDQYMVMEDMGVVNIPTSEMRNTSQTPTLEMKNTANTYFGNEKHCANSYCRNEKLCKYQLWKLKTLQTPTAEMRNTLQIPHTEMKNSANAYFGNQKHSANAYLEMRNILQTVLVLFWERNSTPVNQNVLYHAHPNSQCWFSWLGSMPRSKPHLPL